MKKICLSLLALVMVVLVVMPVAGADLNETNVTSTTGIVDTTTEIPVTTEVVTESTTVNATPVISTVATTSPTVTIGETTVPVTTLTTSPGTTTVSVTTGNITAASSPMGAALLIDGVYRGTTPVDLTGIPSGNHIVRLTLSGYYDYEDSSVYVITNQVTSVYGTLHPVGSTSAAVITSAATPEVTTPAPAVTVQPTTSSGDVFENPTVLAAIIGIVTASIGAIATIFPHIKKKE